MGGGPPLSRTIPTRPHCNSSARIEYVGMGGPGGRALAGNAVSKGQMTGASRCTLRTPLNSPNTAEAKSLTLRHGCDILGGTGRGPRKISVR